MMVFSNSVFWMVLWFSMVLVRFFLDEGGGVGLFEVAVEPADDVLKPFDPVFWFSCA